MVMLGEHVCYCPSFHFRAWSFHLHPEHCWFLFSTHVILTYMRKEAVARGKGHGEEQKTDWGSRKKGTTDRLLKRKRRHLFGHHFPVTRTKNKVESWTDTSLRKCKRGRVKIKFHEVMNKISLSIVCSWELKRTV